MNARRGGVVLGMTFSSAIALVFVLAWRSGMSTSGLEGGPELLASVLFALTLPAGALAALAGRFAMPFGLETAFVVTGIAWMVLSIPYGMLLMRALSRAGAASREREAV